MLEAEPLYKRIEKCRVCGCRDLTLFWSGDEQYIVNFPKTLSEECAVAPLTLVMCEHCHLVQLYHTVSPKVLYTEFFYRSGINEMMRAALKDIVDSVSKHVELKLGDAVLDIGCNDGTLLKNYPESVVRIGVDPAENIQGEGYQPDGWYFSKGFFHPERTYGVGSFKVITAIAMFYDLDDPVQFCKDVALRLAHDGVFVVQMNYLGGMLGTNGIDNVSHEHLCYYSLTTLKEVFDRAGLTIFDVELNKVNGSSIRVYAGLGGLWAKKPEETVQLLLNVEAKSKFDKFETYAEFVQRVHANCITINTWLKTFTQFQKKVYCYGASTRGLSFLQILKPARHIRGAAERDPNKIGRYMAGSWLKIVSEEEARRDADVFLVLPWHFFDAIKIREKEWLKKGGIFIVPFPKPYLFSYGYDGQEHTDQELVLTAS